MAARIAAGRRGEQGNYRSVAPVWMRAPTGCHHNSLKWLSLPSSTRLRLAAYRFVVVDNSKSMGSRDGRRRVLDPETRECVKTLYLSPLCIALLPHRSPFLPPPARYVQVSCTRWEETTAVVSAIAELSHTAETPTEIRLLNHAEPVVVGQAGAGDGSSSLAAARALLRSKPNGLTPICLQVRPWNCLTTAPSSYVQDITPSPDPPLQALAHQDGKGATKVPSPYLAPI